MGVVEFLSPLQLDRVDTAFRPNLHNSLWLTMTRAPTGRNQYFSMDLLQDIRTLQKTIESNRLTWAINGTKHPIHYMVTASAHPDYYSLGGDLFYFRDCIRQRDRKSLRDYSRLCADMIYDHATHMAPAATTIALVQGRALGGGFESALAADFIIAEEQSEFGFPEILFGLFPCTGGMSLLARRVGAHQAERMMTNGRMYSASELLKLGVIDEICEQGDGKLAVEKFIEQHSKQRVARQLVQRSRHRIAPLDLTELYTVVDEWADAAMALPDQQLRVMDMLINLQRAAVAG